MQLQVYFACYLQQQDRTLCQIFPQQEITLKFRTIRPRLLWLIQRFFLKSLKITRAILIETLEFSKSPAGDEAESEMKVWPKTNGTSISFERFHVLLFRKVQDMKTFERNEMNNGSLRLCVFRSLILFLSPKNLFNFYLSHFLSWVTRAHTVKLDQFIHSVITFTFPMTNIALWTERKLILFSAYSSSVPLGVRTELHCSIFLNEPSRENTNILPKISHLGRMFLPWPK